MNLFLLEYLALSNQSLMLIIELSSLVLLLGKMAALVSTKICKKKKRLTGLEIKELQDSQQIKQQDTIRVLQDTVQNLSSKFDQIEKEY